MISTAYGVLQRGSAMFQFEIGGVSTKLDVTTVHGVERMSEPFVFDVEVRSRSSSLVKQLGRSATLRLDSDGVAAIRHGILSRITATGLDASTTRYRMRLVPQVATLELRSTCRVFQDLTADEVVTEVLSEHGVDDVENVGSGQRSARPYLVQYRETDLEFIHRLLDDEGMFYFFVHEPDRHIMVIADDAAQYRSLTGASSSLGFDTSGRRHENVSALVVSSALTPDAVRLRDYDPTDPAAELDVRARARNTTGSREWFDYPGGFADVITGEHRARARLQAVRAAGSSVEVTTNSPRVSPGHTFELVDHPRRPANANYVVVGVTHDGEQDDGADPPGRYVAVASCNDAAATYRRRGDRPAPRMRGPQTATVVGPVGEDRFVDQLGRVKVQFRWDRDGVRDERSSAWIRVVQASAGEGAGSLTVPRIGDEVLVDFIDGDPDRPVIVGSLYNGANLPPVELPDNKHQTIVASSTTQGGERHEFVFDERARDASVRLQSGGRLDIKAKGDAHVNAQNIALAASEQVRVTVGDAQLVIKHGGEIIINGETIDMQALAQLSTLLPNLRTRLEALEQHVAFDPESGQLVLTSPGEIVLKAATNIGLDAAMSVNIDALTIESKSAGVTRIDGALILLN